MTEKKYKMWPASQNLVFVLCSIVKAPIFYWRNVRLSAIEISSNAFTKSSKSTRFLSIMLQKHSSGSGCQSISTKSNAFWLICKLYRFQLKRKDGIVAKVFPRFSWNTKGFTEGTSGAILVTPSEFWYWAKGTRFQRRKWSVDPLAKVSVSYKWVAFHPSSIR